MQVVGPDYLNKIPGTAQLNYPFQNQHATIEIHPRNVPAQAKSHFVGKQPMWNFGLFFSIILQKLERFVLFLVKLLHVYYRLFVSNTLSSIFKKSVLQSWFGLLHPGETIIFSHFISP